MSQVLLNVEDLYISYGQIRALSGISFKLHEGETVSIVGANGAGKTSLMGAISGLIPIDKGRITFLGKNIAQSSTHQLAHMGMLHIPEGRGTLQTLLVEENLRLAWEIRPSKNTFDEAVEVIYKHFPRLYERKQQYAGNLSGGEQQMLAVARALINRPQILLLDEPSMGLSPRFTTEVFKVLKELRDERVSILLVEQNVNRALQLAHRAMVLTHGKFTLEGDASTLANDSRVLTAYMGQN